MNTPIEGGERNIKMEQYIIAIIVAIVAFWLIVSLTKKVIHAALITLAIFCIYITMHPEEIMAIFQSM